MRKIGSEVSKMTRNVQYDMTGGWVFRLRLFCDEEKPDWEEQLAKRATDDDGSVVGAQWNVSQAKEEPPQTFEKGVKCRPSFVRAAKVHHV